MTVAFAHFAPLAMPATRGSERARTRTTRTPVRSPLSRARLGVFGPSALWPEGALTGWGNLPPGRRLTPDELWEFYCVVPDLRAGIEAIARKISTWDWQVTPTVEADDPRHEDLAAIGDEIEAWLQVPNRDGQTWQQLLHAALVDLLVHDQLIFEKARNKLGEVEELVGWDAGEFWPIHDRKKRLKRFDQTPRGSGQTVKFRPKRILWLVLHTATRQPMGVPLIETIVNEASALVFGSEHTMRAWDRDEHPPGVLVLSGMGKSEAEKFQASLQVKAGRDDLIRMLSGGGKSVDAKWVNFVRTMKDLELLPLSERMGRIIWRVLGIQPVLMGDTEKMPLASAKVQFDLSNSHLLEPILELLEGGINANLLPDLLGSTKEERARLAGLLTFRFDRKPRLSPKEAQEQAQADATDIRARRGRPGARPDRRGLRHRLRALRSAHRRGRPHRDGPDPRRDGGRRPRGPPARPRRPRRRRAPGALHERPGGRGCVALLRGLTWSSLELVFGRNQAACAVEVGREPPFARYDGLQTGSVLD